MIFTTDSKKEVFVENNQGLNNYFNNSFNKKLDIKYILGDINDKGFLNGFFIVKFKDKKNIFDLQNKFSSLCINSNLSCMEYSDNKEISKKLLVNFDLRYFIKNYFYHV